MFSSCRRVKMIVQCSIEAKGFSFFPNIFIYLLFTHPHVFMEIKSLTG